MNLFGETEAIQPQPIKKIQSDNNLPAVSEIEEPPKNFYIPHCTINPNYMVFFDKPSNGHDYHAEGLKDNRHKGEISGKASKRIRNMITWFTELSQDKTHDTNGKKCSYRLTFATLTLPSQQQHSDMFIKRHIMGRFIEAARRKWNIINYFWRAEVQEDTGNIHFHFTFDKFIFHAWLRELWNNILRDYGYIKAYQDSRKEFFKNGFRMSDNPHDKRDELKQREAYIQGQFENWSNPNSTDIHGIYKVSNVAGYLAKYVSKNINIFTFKSSWQLWKLKKFFKADQEFSRNLVTIEKQSEGVFKIKLINTKPEALAQWMQEKKIQFADLSEKVIRKIEGMLWNCSKTLKTLKNITLEMSNDVFTGVMELLKTSKPEEKVVMSTNKFTGEKTPNRFVKLFIGKLFTIDKTKDKEDTLTVNFNHSGNNEYLKNFFYKIWDNIKIFFETVHAEETERKLQLV